MDSNVFAEAGMAAGYANSRPPLHAIIVEKSRRLLPVSRPASRAIDIGCGAGLSTRALATVARTCIGMEPAEAMLHAAAQSGYDVAFVVGRAEELPFQGQSADLVTAAGSLNYVGDFERSMAEVCRVLAPGGTLVVYDFSAGRRFRDSPALGEWFERFRTRYPVPAGSARPLDPASLAATVRGLAPSAHEVFEIALELDPEFYLNYMMTETNVVHAQQAGIPAPEIRAWCQAGLAPVFAGEPRTVLFDGYLACFRKSP